MVSHNNFKPECYHSHFNINYNVDVDLACKLSNVAFQ
jgi:hypothetical protein